MSRGRTPDRRLASGSQLGAVLADADPAVDPGVLLSYPAGRIGNDTPLRLGSGALLRSGTVLYAGSSIGARFQAGHNVVVREQCEVGDDVSVWSGSVIDYGCRIGNRVKIHTNCYIAQYTVIEDDVFIAPGVSMANDLYPGDNRSGSLMAGPIIERGAQIGVGTTLLPYVRIGARSIIGAGSVVSRDVPPDTVAYGNPARARARVDDLRPIDERLPQQHPMLVDRQT